MKKLICLFLALILLTGLTVPALAADSSYAGKTVIIFTGNLRGNTAFYPVVKALKDDYAAKGADVLLVDAGNYLQGSAVADTKMGENIYKLMEAADYDVVGMGLAEFSYGEATTGRIYHGNYTRYYTQAMLQSGTAAITYTTNSHSGATATLPGRSYASFAAVCSHLLPLKDDLYAFQAFHGIQTGSGLRFRFRDGDKNDFVDQLQDGLVRWQEAYDTPSGPKVDFDIILCDDAPAKDFEVENAKHQLTIKPSTPGAMMGGVLIIDNATSSVVGQEALSSKGPKDETVAALEAQLKAEADPVLARLEVTLEGRDSVSRSRETNLGDLVTDALVWYAPKYIDGIDAALPTVAIQNGGNLDEFLYDGDLNATNLMRALPFSPMGVGVLQLTGAQLLEALEAATQSLPCPGFPQVSGMKYSVDLDQAYDAGEAYGSFYRANSINRVTIDEIGGQPFDREATYNVVFDNFLIQGQSGAGGVKTGGDTYYVFSDARNAGAKYVNNGNGKLTRDIVAQYIQEELGGVVGETYAAPQGRITLKRTPRAWELFSDVKEKAYYANAVDWAVRQGITNGTGANTFEPNKTCTRGEVVTFLWRAAGAPAPTLQENPFEDARKGFYKNAVLWALENGVTSGTGPTTFEPNKTCTRGEVVTFLWRAAGKPQATDKTNPFSDVKNGYYKDAVLWAVENNITKGTGDGTTFSPNNTCIRGEVVTFLYRAKDLLGN